jgi:antitoxin (DNA-binding transcriptional repressor) of toxin-antitoxin stability system
MGWPDELSRCACERRYSFQSPLFRQALRALKARQRSQAVTDTHVRAKDRSFNLTGLTDQIRLCSVKIIPAYEAKSKFSEILRDAAAGEIFVITRNGQRMAELRPCPPAATQRKRGMMKKEFGPVPADFNEPLADFADYQ